MKESNVQFNDLIAFENQIKSKGAKYWSLSAYFPILHFPACTAKVTQQMRCFSHLQLLVFVVKYKYKT